MGVQKTKAEAVNQYYADFRQQMHTISPVLKVEAQIRFFTHIFYFLLPECEE